MLQPALYFRDIDAFITGRTRILEYERCPHVSTHRKIMSPSALENTTPMKSSNNGGTPCSSHVQSQFERREWHFFIIGCFIRPLKEPLSLNPERLCCLLHRGYRVTASVHMRRFGQSPSRSLNSSLAAPLLTTWGGLNQGKKRR